MLSYINKNAIARWLLTSAILLTVRW